MRTLRMGRFSAQAWSHRRSANSGRPAADVGCRDDTCHLILDLGAPLMKRINRYATLVSRGAIVRMDSMT